MDALADVSVANGTRPLSELLNRECTCVTLDREALCAALEREAGDPDFCATLIGTRPHLFSNAPVFMSEAHVAAMLRTVRAIESIARLPAYRDAVLSRSGEIARLDFGPRGVFMGYDFHLAHDGPKLIEINTNAGGAFLNAVLARAQHACCEEMLGGLRRSEARDFDAAVARMFESEWRLQRKEGTPRRIAIADDLPEEQYLYPEFILAQRFLAMHGMEAVIADAAKLRFERGGLLFEGRPIDLVYNRLVDFALERPEHAALREAYLAGAVVVTPNPRIHALFADKRDLTLLSDPALLRSWGASAEVLADLSAVPRTVPVVPGNAQDLWRNRKKLFFKPAVGYGSKGVYRGDRMTRRVWGEIQHGRYVAQEYAAPSERVIEVDGATVVRKTDVRLYVYDGNILLTAARLYQGQATNFRMPGSGFAPVFVI
ncbi:MAG TPA: hypothetical protein VLV56_18275 [Burkholderiales bacterium]|nr:hypothetical protein [Burkholderiales bacterium]